MKIYQIKFILLFCFFLCSGCGARGALQPKEGNSLPIKSYGQTQEQSAERLLATSSQARPSRESEILSRSTIRSEDPFDLPPESDIVPSSETLDDLSTNDGSGQPSEPSEPSLR